MYERKDVSKKLHKVFILIRLWGIKCRSDSVRIKDGSSMETRLDSDSTITYQ